MLLLTELCFFSLCMKIVCVFVFMSVEYWTEYLLSVLLFSITTYEHTLEYYKGNIFFKYKFNWTALHFYYLYNWQQLPWNKHNMNLMNIYLTFDEWYEKNCIQHKCINYNISASILQKRPMHCNFYFNKETVSIQ